MYTHTGSNGAFQLAMGVLSGSNYVNLCDQAGVATVVTIMTAGQTICDLYNQCASGSSWGGIGTWNATFVVWDRPFVDADIPSNYVSGFIPMTYDFTNSSYVQFSITSSSTFTTTESYNLSVQGAVSGLSIGGGTSYSASTSVFTSSTISGVTGDSFVLQQSYLTSGTWVFNALFNRVIRLFPDYYAPYVTGSGPTNVSDWLSRPACGSDPGVVICEAYEASTPFSRTMLAGGSYTLGSSFDVGVTASYDIDGLVAVSAGFKVDYSTSFTSSTSYGISFTVSPPSGVCYGFEYEFQGDGSGTSGVVAHVWNLGDQPQSEC
jgi:hypothetical protein